MVRSSFETSDSGVRDNNNREKDKMNHNELGCVLRPNSFGIKNRLRIAELVEKEEVEEKTRIGSIDNGRV